MPLDYYFGKGEGMKTGSTRQNMMMEEAGVAPLTLTAIQYIINAVENVESRLDKRLSALEEQIGVVNKNVGQLSNRVQQIEAEYEKEKEQLAVMTAAFKGIENGHSEQQGVVEDLIQQVEIIDNSNRRANIRITKLKENLGGGKVRLLPARILSKSISF